MVGARLALVPNIEHAIDGTPSTRDATDGVGVGKRSTADGHLARGGFTVLELVFENGSFERDGGTLGEEVGQLGGVGSDEERVRDPVELTVTLSLPLDEVLVRDVTK